jgi:hypothetical protein
MRNLSPKSTTKTLVQSGRKPLISCVYKVLVPPEPNIPAYVEGVYGKRLTALAKGFRPSRGLSAPLIGAERTHSLNPGQSNQRIATLASPGLFAPSHALVANPPARRPPGRIAARANRSAAPRRKIGTAEAPHVADSPGRTITHDLADCAARIFLQSQYLRNQLGCPSTFGRSEKCIFISVHIDRTRC